MTPEERNLVTELFDRLATLENAPRDPDAERLIKDGLRQAPNATYALVQTALVQDEALKRADARIRELEGEPAADAPRTPAFSTACATPAGPARRARLGAVGAAPEARAAACRRPGDRHAGDGARRRRACPWARASRRRSGAAAPFSAPRRRQRPA